MSRPTNNQIAHALREFSQTYRLKDGEQWIETGSELAICWGDEYHDGYKITLGMDLWYNFGCYLEVHSRYNKQKGINTRLTARLSRQMKRAEDRFNKILKEVTEAK